VKAAAARAPASNAARHFNCMLQCRRTGIPLVPGRGKTRNPATRQLCGGANSSRHFQSPAWRKRFTIVWPNADAAGQLRVWQRFHERVRCPREK
jgi:hypothetical protein